MTTAPEHPIMDMPGFYCPIEPAIHPDTASIETKAHGWLARWNYFDKRPDRVLDSRSAEFYARMVPHGQADRLQIAVEWTYLGFVFDDAYCDSAPWNTRTAEFARLTGRILRMLESPGSDIPEPHDCMRPLADIAHKFAEVGTPVQYRRWVLAHRAWLTGVLWQIGNQSDALMPSLDDYLAMRINSAAGEPVIAMIELVTGPQIPANELDCPAVRACTEMAQMLASLDNDIQSYAKDQHRNEADQNIVNVLVHQWRCPRSEAVRGAVAVRDRIMCRFLQLREKTTRHQSAPTRRYLADLGHVVRGNLDWGFSTPRYRVPGSTPPGSWADRPHDTGTEPPASTIAWWWDRHL
ncbi:terpene synthase family protein [Nocardia sp. BMG51109]|uniref:terpene synthase family protein n=1 Tax=Nocardia sp. BMG51109 TaxID=1056816 RepID=UPI0004B9CAAD|nr:terpene synthase family protein [Nocardia sp. BMG51109]